MNQDIKRQWVEALRSGEYEQTKGTLKQSEPHPVRPVGYCCLGVLTDLAIRAGVTSEWVSGLDGYEAVRELYEGDAEEVLESSSLPESTQAWAQLSEVDPIVGPRGCRRTLSRLNDDGHTFLEIADLIERDL